MPSTQPSPSDSMYSNCTWHTACCHRKIIKGAQRMHFSWTNYIQPTVLHQHGTESTLAGFPMGFPLLGGFVFVSVSIFGPLTSHLRGQKCHGAHLLRMWVGLSEIFRLATGLSHSSLQKSSSTFNQLIGAMLVSGMVIIPFSIHISLSLCPCIEARCWAVVVHFH